METTQRTIPVIDSDGARVAIIETQHYTRFRGLSKQSEPLPTRKELATEDGQPVNALKDGTFQNVITEEIFRAT